MMTWIRHFRDQARSYALVFIGVAVALVIAEDLFNGYADLKLRRQDASEWVEYHAIGFVEEDTEGRGGLGALRMSSRTTIHREVFMEFLDTLRCETPGRPGEFEFVSQNPKTEGFVASARPTRTGNWLFNADYPKGRVCRVDSVITLTVDRVSKPIEISSQVFTVR